MTEREFDIFVLGTGSGGKMIAFAGAKAGLKVGIVDNREYGGTCANRGCDPKKVLVGLTEILNDAADMKGRGIVKLPESSWHDLMEYKKTFTDPVAYVHERNLKKAGIETFHGSPQFMDENTLSIADERIKADKIVIATGQKQAELKIPGGEYAQTSDDFLSLQDLPKSIIFIGGGYIGMELSHIAARFGVEVTVIHSSQRPLHSFDSEMVDYLTEASKELGIKFLFKARAQEIEKKGNLYIVTATQDGKKVSQKAEMVINSAGRSPSIDELNLEKGKISYNKRGVSVNEYMQNPTNKNVYACGDVADSAGLPLSPLSPYEANIVIDQLYGKAQKPESYPVQPSAVFTVPNLAMVGLTEEKAIEKGYEIEIKSENAIKWYKAKQTSSKVYAYKIIIDKNTRKIRGAHIVGKAAAEMINLFTMAINCGLTVEEIKRMIFAYPTWGNEIKAMV